MGEGVKQGENGFTLIEIMVVVIIIGLLAVLVGPRGGVMLAGPDVLVILVIAFVIFGSNRITAPGAGLGKRIRNFKKGLESDETIQKQLEENSGKS